MPDARAATSCSALRTTGPTDDHPSHSVIHSQADARFGVGLM